MRQLKDHQLCYSQHAAALAEDALVGGCRLGRKLFDLSATHTAWRRRLLTNYRSLSVTWLMT